MHTVSTVIRVTILLRQRSSQQNHLEVPLIAMHGVDGWTPPAATCSPRLQNFPLVRYE
eukprot:COSAG02_NODE_1140_length_14275_cov_154.904557_5_plen_58_part_00